MKKFWYLPVAAVLGAAGLTVWAQANAGPLPAVSPGAVVADMKSGEDKPKTEDIPARAPIPSASITAVPEPAAGETQLMRAEPPTVPPVVDDKGGLRAPGVSDDGPTHDARDDKGGVREAGDDKGGDR